MKARPRTVIPEQKRYRALVVDDVEIKSIDQDHRVIWHTVTREVTDRMGDIVRLDGADVREFLKKPAVLYGHDYRSMNPVPVIAENIGFERQGDRLYAGTRFLAVDTPGMSQGLKDLINDNWLLHAKKLLGWSIGFVPVDWAEIVDGKQFKGFDFKSWKLLEYSSVIIPAHQDAVNDAMNGGEISGAVVKIFDMADKAEFVIHEQVPDEDDIEQAPPAEPEPEPAIDAAEEEAEEEDTKHLRGSPPEDIDTKAPERETAPEKTETKQHTTGGIMLQDILKKLASNEELTVEEKDYLAQLEAKKEQKAEPVRKLALVDEGSGVKVRAMNEIVNLPAARLNEVERELQRFNDDVYIASAILKRNPRELKMWDNYFGRSSSLRKAMDTATATEGAEWVPTLLSADFIERMRLEAKVAALFSDVNMPSNPYKIPYSAGLSASNFYYVGESISDSPTASPVSTPVTGDQTLTARKLKARILFSDEIAEDSIVPVIPHIRGELVRAAAETIEDVIINGDTTATHQDSDVTDARDRRKAWNGLRDLAQSGNKADHGTFSTANFLTLLKTMGKYGMTPSELAIIVGPTGYHLFRALAEVFTVDKYGPSATVLNGELGKLAGIPIIASDYIRQNLNASGVYDGVTQTKTVYTIVNRRGFVLGTRGTAKLSFETDASVDQNQLTLSIRKAFQPVWTPSSTVTTIAIGYNVA